MTDPSNTNGVGCIAEGCPRKAQPRRRGYCNRCYGIALVNETLPRLERRRMPLGERLRRNVQVDAESGCWLWTSNTDKGGYAETRVFIDGKPVTKKVHRLIYLTEVGPIPDGHQIDHLCRVRHCINPAHLEAVTPQENFLRTDAPSAVAVKTNRCKRGHEFTPETTNFWFDKKRGKWFRRCRPCALAYYSARWQSQKAAA